jgi:ribonuclease HIII
MITNEQAHSLKILDLGIAKIKKDNNSFSISGTEGYMPPEGYKNNCDESYDVFSVGVVYYTLIINDLPYRNIQTLKEEDYLTAQDIALDKLIRCQKAPRLVRDFIMKAIQLNNKSRFLSIQDMNNLFQVLLQKLNNHKEAINNCDPQIRNFYEVLYSKLTKEGINFKCFEFTQGFNKCLVNLSHGKKGFKFVKQQALNNEAEQLQLKIENIALEIINTLKPIKVPGGRLTLIEGEFSNIPEVNKFLRSKLDALGKNNITFVKKDELKYGTKFNFMIESINVPVVIYYSLPNGISFTFELKGHNELKAKINLILRSHEISEENSFRIPFERWIGSDESGKGDYFGPLVGASFFVDRAILNDLIKLGIKDSKQISDSKIEEISKILISKYKDRIAICELIPEKYNELYQKFLTQGGNLNKLLAWCHARVIQDLAEKFNVDGAIADQFGDESYILNEIKNNGKMKDAKELKLIQRPKAEENLAVAAASILARDRFIRRIKEYSIKFKITIPKGASTEVNKIALFIKEKYGVEELKKVVKLHFKNSKEIIK